MEPSEQCDEEHAERFNDRGTGLVEYALMVSLIMLVCIAAVTYFQEATTSSFSRSGEQIQVAGT